MRNATASPEPQSLIRETLLSFAEAARKLPPFRAGRPVNPSTVFRWAFSGVRLPSGELLRLEAVRIGGRWLTSSEALERFAARQTPQFAEPTPTPRSSSARQKAAAAASRECEKLGLRPGSECDPK